MRERNTDRLPLICHLWDRPATQACALTGNRTCDPLLCRSIPKQLSHTGQGEYLL